MGLLVAVLYANTLGNAFVWDDALTAARAAPGGPLHLIPGSYYRPVTMLTFAMDRRLWGHNPAGFHLTNMLCHFGVCWLLFALCTAFGMPPGPALAASLIFAAHPLQTEAVSYISGRTDILCGLFALLTVHVWLRARRPFDRYAVGSTALLLLALLSKETAVLLPAALLPSAKRARSAIPVLPLLAAAIWLILFTRTGPGLRIAGIGDRLGAVAGAALTYVRLLVWPLDLHLERFTPVEGWTVAGTVLAWAVLATIAAGIVRTARRIEGGLLWPALAAATYAPVSGLLPIYPQIADRALFTPEHALYLPLLGLAPLASAGVAHRCPARLRTAVLPVALVVLLVAWGTIVVRRNRDWRDEDTLFEHTLAYDPPVGRVWFNLGNLRLRAGENSAATALYREALRRSPNDPAVHFNLGIALQRQGKLGAAEDEYARTIAIDPDFLEAYRAQAILLAARGEREAAGRLLAEEQRRQRRD